MNNIEYSYQRVSIKKIDKCLIDNIRKEQQLSFLCKESFVSLASDISDNSPKKSSSKASKTSFEDLILGNRLI